MLDARKGFRADDPLRALGIRDAPVVLDDSRREEIAARLLAGEAPDAILAALLKAGLPLAAVRA